MWPTIDYKMAAFRTLPSPLLIDFVLAFKNSRTSNDSVSKLDTSTIPKRRFVDELREFSLILRDFQLEDCRTYQNTVSKRQLDDPALGMLN